METTTPPRHEHVNSPAAAGVAKQKLEFAYDATGRRIQNKVSTWTGSGYALASDLRFAYDGWNLLAELNALSGNAPIRTYAWGLDLSRSMRGAGGVGGLLFAATSTATHGAAYDGNGNIIGFIAMNDGTTGADLEYDGFGTVLKATGPAADLYPFGFSTKYTDSETAAVYYGFRYYNPSTGLWLSRDPIEEKGGTNLYGFCKNDSTDKYDELGLVVKTFDLSDVLVTHEDFLPKPKEFEQIPGEVLGVTKPRPTRGIFPKKIDGCCTEISIIGQLFVTVTIVNGMDDTLSKNLLTTRRHEFRHAKAYADAWNSYARIANSLEGKWCGDCVEKALNVETAAFNLYEAQGALLSRHLDNWEYGAPWSGEQDRFNTLMAELVMKAAQLIATCKKQ